MYTISWTGYVLTIALLTAGYYLAIYLLYFRADFSILPSTSSRHPFSEMADKREEGSWKGEGTHPVESGFEDNVDSEELLHACLDEITAFFEEARRSKSSKETILPSLRRLLLKYPTLQKDFKNLISHVIMVQCQNLCAIRLVAGDVESVWVD
jgi:predicted glycosyl hydrolase (DUF1957 family)